MVSGTRLPARRFARACARTSPTVSEKDVRSPTNISRRSSNHSTPRSAPVGRGALEHADVREPAVDVGVLRPERVEASPDVRLGPSVASSVLDAEPDQGKDRERGAEARAFPERREGDAEAGERAEDDGRRCERPTSPAQGDDPPPLLGVLDLRAWADRPFRLPHPPSKAWRSRIAAVRAVRGQASERRRPRTTTPMNAFSKPGTRAKGRPTASAASAPRHREATHRRRVNLWQVAYPVRERGAATARPPPDPQETPSTSRRRARSAWRTDRSPIRGAMERTQRTDRRRAAESELDASRSPWLGGGPFDRSARKRERRARAGEEEAALLQPHRAAIVPGRRRALDDPNRHEDRVRVAQLVQHSGLAGTDRALVVLAAHVGRRTGKRRGRRFPGPRERASILLRSRLRRARGPGGQGRPTGGEPSPIQSRSRVRGTRGRDGRGEARLRPFILTASADGAPARRATRARCPGAREEDEGSRDEGDGARPTARRRRERSRRRIAGPSVDAASARARSRPFGDDAGAERGGRPLALPVSAPVLPTVEIRPQRAARGVRVGGPGDQGLEGERRRPVRALPPERQVEPVPNAPDAAFEGRVPSRLLGDQAERGAASGEVEPPVLEPQHASVLARGRVSLPHENGHEPPVASERGAHLRLRFVARLLPLLPVVREGNGTEGQPGDGQEDDVVRREAVGDGEREKPGEEDEDRRLGGRPPEERRREHEALPAFPGDLRAFLDRPLGLVQRSLRRRRRSRSARQRRLLEGTTPTKAQSPTRNARTA